MGIQCKWFCARPDSRGDPREISLLNTLSHKHLLIKYGSPEEQLRVSEDSLAFAGISCIDIFLCSVFD